MALTHIGSAAVAGTSITIPAHNAGDIILIFPYKDGATSQPTVPAAGGSVPTWVTIDAPVGSNLNVGGSYRAIGTGSTTSGTWLGATGMAVSVWRGQHATPIGGHAGAGGAAANSTIAPALTQSDTSGLAALIHFIGHRTVTAWGAAPSGYTQRASVATETIVLTKDSTSTDGAVTQADTAVNGGYWGCSIELLPAVVVVTPAQPKGVRRPIRALIARARHQQARRLGAPSATTPTPLVRQRVVHRKRRPTGLAARRRHRNIVQARPPAPKLLTFVRPAITLIRRSRQALNARRRHHGTVQARPPRSGLIPWARPAITVVKRSRQALHARRRHRSTPVVRPPRAAFFRPAAIVVRHTRRAVENRRRHRQAILIRPPAPAFYRHPIATIRHTRQALVARRRHHAATLIRPPQRRVEVVRQRIVVARRGAAARFIRRARRLPRLLHPRPSGVVVVAPPRAGRLIAKALPVAEVDAIATVAVAIAADADELAASSAAAAAAAEISAEATATTITATSEDG